MPALQDILQDISSKKSNAQDEVRRKWLKKLAGTTKRDTIIYASAFTSHNLPGIPIQAVSVSLQDVQGMMAALHGLKGNDQLDLILHSPGGSLEAAEQLVNYLRSKYRHIRAIIPQNAMSAATMIACACDEIVMGKHSAIGPIDPQITFPTPSGRQSTAPAQAIIDEFKRAKDEVAADPKCAQLWVSKIREYPHGFLQQCETAIVLAKDKVSEWLDRWMFRDMQGQKPGAAIGEWLSDHQQHRTHGRPIGLAVARDKGLIVKALEDDQDFQDAVLSVFHATMVTFQVTPSVKIIENQLGKGWYLRVQVQEVRAG